MAKSLVEKTVDIIFQGDDRISGTLKGINASFGKFENYIGDLATPLARVGDTILGIDAALAAMAVGGMAFAIKKSGEFGDSFNEISTLLNITEKDLSIFRNSILDYSRESGKSIEDIESAIYSAISAGVSYEQSLGVLTDAEKLSIAGRSDLESTTKLLASTLNAYGSEIDESTKYSDIFFRTVKNGQTTIPELAQSLANVTGIAASGNVPIETLTASIAAITASGAPTSQAITMVKGAIQSIIKPTSEASQIADRLNIQFNAQSLASKGLEGVLNDVYRATGGNIDQMAKLFGSVEGLNGAVILAADKQGKFKEALESNRSAAGATAEAYEKMGDNIAVTNQRISNNIDATLIQIGDKLQTGYSDIGNSINDILEAIGRGIDKGTFDEFFGFIDDFAKKTSKFMEEIARALPEALEEVDFTVFINALKELGGSVSDFFDDLDLSDPEDLANAIQWVVDSMASLINVTAGMIEYFKPLWEAIKESINRFNEMDSESQKAFGNILGAAELVAKAGVKIGLALVAIKESGADIGAVFETVTGGIKTVWNSLQVAFDALAIAASYVVKSLAWVSEQYYRYIARNEEAANNLAEVAQSYDTVIEKFKKGLSTQWGEMTAGTKQMLSGIEELSNGTKRAIDNIPEKKEFTIDWTQEADRIMEELNGVKSAIDEIPEKKEVTISPEIDMAKVEETKKVFEDAGRLKAKVDLEELELTETQIKEMSKTIQLKLEVDKEDIKALQDTINSITETMKSSSEIMTGAFSALAQPISANLDFWESSLIIDALENEMKIREEAAEQQKKLTEEEILLMELKRRYMEEAFESGQGLITINADGLEPELEAFMWKIMKRVQVRANEVGAEFLLGI